MLKRKRMITSCSLSSCRIKAEALARVFNSRIWPCTWVDRRRAEDSAEEDEEYFETSPVEEDGDENLSSRGRNSSAATVEGRAKLFELLQQHATDDATEVYYDVSEHVENDVAGICQKRPIVDDEFEEILLNDSSSSSSKNITSEKDICLDGLTNGESDAIDSVPENSSPVAMKNYTTGDCMFTSEVSMTSSDKKEFQPVVEKSDLFESHEIEIYPPLIKNTAAEEINTSEVSSSLTFNNVENIEIISNNSDCNPNTDLNSETVKTISVGNEEVLSVEVDSESYNSHLQEKDEINSINQENNTIDTTVNNSEDSQIQSDCTVERETENISKNSDGNVSTNFDDEILKTISFENDEVLSVEIDSESYSFHLHGKGELNSNKQENNTIDTTVNNSEDSQIQSDCTVERETEKISKNSDDKVSTDFDDEILKTINFENDEMLSVEIDSESYSFHFHGKDEIISTKQENNTINNSEDSQIQSDGTDEQGTEIVSKDLVSIEVKPCSPTKKGEQPSETNVEAHGKCHLKVFNELRPKISRSTSLKTGKTPPGTPSRKKIVRFADVLGLDLEDVRHIISGDLPNIPSSAYNDLVLPDEDLPSKVNPSVTYELKGIQCKTWDNIQQGAIGLNTVYPLFDIPGQQPNFMDRVRNTGVCLESLIISDFNVQCTCRVMNWGFTKKVIARYTTDNWLSSNDINASYIVDSSREGTDSFAFTIFLSQQRRDVQFALLYQVNGKEHWDNNNGKNYCLGYHGTDNIGHSAVPTSPIWMDQFW